MQTEDKARIDQGFATQLPRNLAANIVYFLANIVIGILLVPYFIKTLGVGAYGLIPLATSITGYVAIIVQSLNTAVSRFLTINLQQEDYVAANKTFNTALFGLTVVILLMIPVILIIAYFAPLLFHVPAGQETGAVLLLLGVLAAFLIRSWSGSFTVQLFAYNRLDLQNLVNITNLVVQTGLIIILFKLLGPDLGLVGGAYLVGALVASGVSIILARQVCPHLRVSIRYFDRRAIRDLCEMGWWVVVNNIGALLFLQIDLIVVNLLFGATSAGEYAIALQWSSFLRAMAGMLSGVLAPSIISCYARRQTETLIRATKSAVKLMGLAMALPIGLVCGFAPELLTIWVGDEFAFLWPLIVLLTVHLTINLAVLPIFLINISHNRVRVPGIVTLFMGIGNFGLAVSLPLLTGMGYYGVAAAGAIVLTLKNAFFIPWYATRVLRVASHTFSRSMIPGITATVLIAISAALLGEVITFPVTLAIASAAITSIYFVAIWIFALDGSERQLFKSYLTLARRRIVA
ncbi:oligosaccharide flippase family protein [Methanothrix thermoacetophila]|uniref:Polysaccharide biosynthesis protein n=1 Tax=Methanothrix thermoacetophila (strain DSM 6194 / JCM 14653 / NBRC 101360 / PT) TaxID=349307 RepID=A0B7S2_METTP|nr:oligosaccharide flippase family protein [Methanothrix thermoacetophila]ABK14746.1 polysaccharide biosynthesis protein [Methanothrix thermoacetophila PT]